MGFLGFSKIPSRCYSWTKIGPCGDPRCSQSTSCLWSWRNMIILFFCPFLDTNYPCVYQVHGGYSGKYCYFGAKCMIFLEKISFKFRAKVLLAPPRLQLNGAVFVWSYASASQKEGELLQGRKTLRVSRACAHRMAISQPWGYLGLRYHWLWVTRFPISSDTFGYKEQSSSVPDLQYRCPLCQNFWLRACYGCRCPCWLQLTHCFVVDKGWGDQRKTCVNPETRYF